MNKIKVLSFIDYYYPGFKAGGPIRTMENLVNSCSTDIEFFIVTRNSDIDGSRYDGFCEGVWYEVGGAKVCYVKSSGFGLGSVRRLLKNVKPDVVYLNSFFSVKFSILPFLYLIAARGPGVVLAPRGELARSALSYKWFRKRIYLQFFKLMRRLRRLILQASSQDEALDINAAVKCADEYIFVAPDVPAFSRLSFGRETLTVKDDDDGLRLIFVSRISPVKNLDYLLDILGRVRSNVVLRIYGPIEDDVYFSKCQALIDDLPGNIIVYWLGELSPDKVGCAFSRADIFAFPTRGENFGHVIFESLAAGTPVLVSDRTPWRDDGTDALKVIGLNDPDLWVESIERFAQMNSGQLMSCKIAALKYAEEYIASDDSVRLSVQIFRLAVGDLLECD